MKPRVDRRPILPIGDTFLSAWTVTRPIYCTEDHECYSIETENKTSFWGAAIRCRTEADCLRNSQISLSWWKIVQTGTQLRLLEHKICNRGGWHLILASFGTGEVNSSLELPMKPLLNQHQAETLMIDLVKMCKLALSHGYYPLIEAGAVLLVQQNEELKGIPLFVETESGIRGGNETACVEAVAMFVYGLATGIDIKKQTSRSVQRKTEIPPANRWNEEIDSSFSGLLMSCLEKRGPNQITTLSILETRLRGSFHSDSSNEITASPRSNKSGGLAKVAGMAELKGLLIADIIHPIQDPEPYKLYGIPIPNGILLYGPPGCGKTYIARQLAEELGWYFNEVKGSDIGSIYIHGTGLAIRDLFDEAEKHSPSLVFIDEFEGLVPKRSDLSGYQQHTSAEVNEFLVHLNECANKKILVIAATNEPSKIDEAVRRPGRLDKMIYVGPPDLEARCELLKMYLSNRPLSNLDFEDFAKKLDGYSCVDIRNITDESARLALKEGELIGSNHLAEAIRRNPPSLSPDILSKYQHFQQRGI